MEFAAVGDVSGAHLNPAVTAGFVLAKRMPAPAGFAYVGAQIAGALIASAILRVLFPAHLTLGATVPSGAAHQSFVLELLMTAILMYVILRVTTGAKEKGITAGLAIGGVIGLEALFGGPVSGASMNPARSSSTTWSRRWVAATPARRCAQDGAKTGTSPIPGR